MHALDNTSQYMNTTHDITDDRLYMCTLPSLLTMCTYFSDF